MKFKFKTKTILSVIVSMTLLTGCATYKEYENDKEITIEKTDSIMAHITRVGLYKTEGNEIKLRGELKRKPYLLAPIPGHLDIELVGLKGKVIKQTQLNYRRKSTKSLISYFSISLPVEPALLSAVRIKHHNAGSHSSDLKLSPWQDVNPSK